MGELFINFSSDSPLYKQLYEKIKRDILSGYIQKGEKLPSKRKLSSNLQVSKNTIESAYQQLAAEGYVEMVPRSGVYVKSVLEQDTWSRTREYTNEEIIETEDTETINFSQGLIDEENFPLKEWKKCMLQALDMPHILQSGHAQGEISLRKEIADYLYQARGVICTPDQIVIGAGTQYLLRLLTLLLQKGTSVAFENPGYYRARETLRKEGMKMIPISVTKEGISVNKLVETMASVVYCTPSHQFPLGAIMPISNRQQLIQWARERNAYIIEDDYDGEFRYEGKPIPALQGIDSFGRVVYLGTFSKSLLPSLRLNYMVLPYDLLEKFHLDLPFIKQTVSKIDQQTVTNFIKAGYMEKHMNKMRTLYRRKRAVLIREITQQLGEAVVIKGEKSGVHIVLEVRGKYSEQQLVELANKKGVKVLGTSIFYFGQKPKHPSILIGYGGVSEKEIKSGIEKLAFAWLS